MKSGVKTTFGRTTAVTRELLAPLLAAVLEYPQWVHCCTGLTVRGGAKDSRKALQ